MDVIISKESIDLLESDVLIMGLFQDQKPLRGSIGWIDWRLNGMLSRYLIENRLTGEWGERTLIPSQGRIEPRLILVFGLGQGKAYGYLFVREAIPFMLETLRNLKTSHLSLSLPYGEEYRVDCGKLAEVFIEALSDHPDRYPSDREWVENLTLSLGEHEERFSEILVGVQTAQKILKDRLPIRILTPSDALPKRSRIL